MLNFVYWPISVVLWFWHKVFSLVLDPGSGWSWVLAIMFLTFTIRALLVKPMISSMRSMTKMQELQPQLAEIKERYKNDQQKQLEETRRLQKELGVNPVAGCLPMLVQMPVFIGLFHVLRSFNRTGNGPGALGLSIEENRNLPNYFFSVEDVQSFLDARFFGVPLSAYITMPEDMYQAFQPVDFTRTTIMMVAVPLIIIIALATHLNGRHSVARTRRRQAQGLSKTPQSGQMQMQAEMMNKMMVWFFPFMIVFTGAVWHIGLLFYMMANNLWTFFQQRWMFAKLDREEAAALQAKKDAKRATAPRPGVKPVNPKKQGKKATHTPAVDSDTTGETASGTATLTQPGNDSGKKTTGFRAAFQQMKADAEREALARAAEKQAAKTASGQSATTPKPGAKPQRNRKKKRR
ncbi:membrane protein insertase YidC [Corynebacterium choanae]|uniref:Membrane protein insertase YidC n=1 Tax=Corynebacterium choanae TaxID=1862358 RepID=A0A3G6JA04_9CORY|nr:membrane protein insertase YidC [Corynebacterium choanae]AZA14739.1 Membrane protein insertase YidC [Corynebacterium choanae]